MNVAKKVLAVLALAFMVVFVGAIVVLTVAGRLFEQSVWIYGSLTGFLLCGLASLGINWLMKQRQ